MTLFLLLGLVLAAITLAILLRRAPADAHVTDPAEAAIAAARPSRGLAIALSLAVLAVTIGGYAWIGSPGLLPVTPDAPPGPGPAAEAQVAALQRRAEKNPDDAAGWVQAGRGQLEVGRPADAARDYRRALALRPNNVDLMADLADVLAASADGKLDGEPMQLVDRVLALDPDHVKALALKGSQAMALRDYRTALATWDHAIRVAPKDDPIAAFLRHELDTLREAASRGAPAASAPAPGASPPATASSAR